MSDSLKTLESSLVSCVIRFHAPEKLEQLSLALMSIAGQSYCSVEPIIVLQDFSDTDRQAVENLCRDIPWPASFIGPTVVNVTGLGSGDHRSELANAGIAARSGALLSFLDYDDVIYGSCYKTLIERLMVTGCVASFVGTIASDTELTANGPYISGKRIIFKNKNKYEFFFENQHPIHSFMLKTDEIDEGLLRFQPGLSRNEDYIFLLRILSRYKWDTQEHSTPLTEYQIRIDGTNTIMSPFENASIEKQTLWQRSHEHLASLRQDIDIQMSVGELHGLIEHLNARKKNGPDGPDHDAIKLKHTLRSALSSAGDLKETTPYGSLDICEPFGSGKFKVAGWIAGPDKEPLVSVVITEDISNSKCLPVSILIDQARPDVGLSLGTEETGFGFVCELPGQPPENPILIGIDEFGHPYLLTRSS